MSEAERASLREALLAYVQAHPDASDTIDGIRAFWLASQPACSALNLSLVLRELVAQGVFAVITLPDGKHLYSATGVERST